ncbi:hypothetical protein HYY74_00040 [Candidatus Woesearchaeota archaeon]|nr:hypothetical protein [Candidatus Woesearchaeota archaeon]
MPQVTLETIHRELVNIRGDIEFLKHVMGEEYKLSDWAKKELAEARKIPESGLSDHEEVRRRILQR